MDQLYTVIKEDYSFQGESLTLCLPDAEEVRRFYQADPTAGKPYWTVVWPSASALCHFIVEHPHLFTGREVWEPGAGLGLPSLLVARFARKVIASDLSLQAVELVRQSARLNKITNLQAEQMDWNRMPALTADIVMLADVNYDPFVFDEVAAMINRCLYAGCTVLLATPARITSPAFMELVRPYIIRTSEYTIGNRQVLLLTLNGNDQVIQHHRAEDQLEQRSNEEAEKGSPGGTE